MKLGAYTACLHDKPVEEALQILRDLGLDSAEINSGGFLPAVHLPVDAVRSSDAARDEYLGLFTASGVALTALNCNGNPLHPDPEVREKHANDLRESIEIAALLGVKRIVTMSGLPGERGGDPARLERPAVGQRVPRLARLPVERGGDPVLEGHRRSRPRRRRPGLHRDAPAQRRLQPRHHAAPGGADQRHPCRRRDGPSHLFWQGIDPVLAIEALGDLVYNAAAKDVRINEAAKINGVPTTASAASRRAPRASSRSAAATRSARGPRTRHGTSSRSAAATTSRTGAASCRPSRRSIPTWPSTSSTRTRSSTSSTDCATRPTPC
jgi:hypothetical protein